MLTTTLPSYVNGCRKPSRKHKCSPHQRLRDRSGTLIERLMPFHWNQVTWSWLKLMPTREREESEGLVGGWTIWKGVHQIAEGIPSYLLKNWQMGCLWVLHWNWLFLITPTKGTPLHMVVQTEHGQGVPLPSWRSKLWKTMRLEEVPQSVNCLLPAQHQTDETPEGQVNRKLCTFLWTFSGASLLDQG